MTSLYRLDCSAGTIADALHARVGNDPWAGGYIAPGKFAPVVTAGRDFIAGPRPSGGALTARLVPRLWGVLPPESANDPARRVTTLRNPESPFWIGNLRNAEFRCVIPATAIMLWGSGIDYEGRRCQHWFARDGGPVLAIAGVWKDEEVPAFAMLTQAANGPAKAVGAKAMPLILPDQASRDGWLHGPWDQAQRLINRPLQPSLIEIDTPAL